MVAGAGDSYQSTQDAIHIACEKRKNRMLFRSTGLGKTEMVAQMDGVKRQGDYLVMNIKTSEPVIWKVRVAMNFRDVARVLKALIAISVIRFMFSPRQWFKKKADHPGDF